MDSGGARKSKRPPRSALPPGPDDEAEAPLPDEAGPTRIRRGPSLWATLATLAALVILQHAGALTAPFFSDDYILLDKLRNASFLSVWEPKDLAYHWYRPWSRELHYWTFFRLFGLDPLPYHIASFTLWLAGLGLYFAFIARMAGRGTAAVATAGAASLALWIVPIEWAAGVQDLWMLLFALLSLHAYARGRDLLGMGALALALLSKETAAVLPLIALVYSLAVERAGWRHALRRVVPFVALVAVWAALHPSLGGRLWWAQGQTALPSIRTPPLQSAFRSLLAVFNLDLRPAPLGGWWLALIVSAPGALVLAFLALRGALAMSRNSSARLLVFGAAWAFAAWLPLLSPSVLWQPYYAAFGALGAWLAIAVALERARWLAVALVLALGLLRGARAETASRDWGNVVLQRFGKSFMGRTEAYMRQRFPALPPHTRLFFTTVPRGVVFITGPGDTPALRVWYGDSTLAGSYWGDFRPRAARDPSGPDYFFRYDSLAGWIEVRPGPENLRAAQATNPDWRMDHVKLARTFVDAGDVRSAATEYEKLAGVHPDDAEYAYLLGLAFTELGVRDSAALWLTRAAALPGADEEMRRKAGDYGRSK